MTCVFIRRGDMDADAYKGKTMQRHTEKTDIFKTKIEASEEINPLDTLILDFEPSNGS
jgi:hypothetical protein